MKKIKTLIISFLLILTYVGKSKAVVTSTGSGGDGVLCNFVNPISDVCWTCLFPVRIGGAPVTGFYGNYDTNTAGGNPVCTCGIRLGITMSIWHPVRLAEVVKSPWKFPSLCLDTDLGVSPSGGTMSTATTRAQKNTLQSHWYFYPLLAMTGLVHDFACVSSSTISLDIAYVSELDPSWNVDFVNVVVNPEELLLAAMELAADFACIPDGLFTSAKRFGITPLFWCAGNWGTIYPIFKTSYGGWTVSSALTAARTAGFLHKTFVAWKTTGRSSLCTPTPYPIIPKEQYRFQVGKPIVGHTCFPIGTADFWWASFKEPVVKDTYHTFIIWRKRDCCAF